jgi:hypothetical protein
MISNFVLSFLLLSIVTLLSAVMAQSGSFAPVSTGFGNFKDNRFPINKCPSKGNCGINPCVNFGYPVTLVSEVPFPFNFPF